MTSLSRKQTLLDELVARLTEALELAQRAHRAAVEGATHAEAKPENDKDTRGLEQSYLARGQSLRIAEQAAQLAELKVFQLRPFSEETPIGLGALVTLEDDERSQLYLILPHGGGQQLAGGTVQVVTPAAPICRAMVGKRVGDESIVSLGGKQRELSIAAVE